MGNDTHIRGISGHKKRKFKEPFVMIGSEILNSTSYTSLSFSARSMLVEVLHFYTGINNGCIWISPDVLASRGFSKNTVTKALKELRIHGFLYMTKRGGNQRGGCSWFALTWLPINKVEGQYLGSFISNAYRQWTDQSVNNKGSNFGVSNPKKRELLVPDNRIDHHEETRISGRKRLKTGESIPNIVTYKDMPYIWSQNRMDHPL